MSPSDRGDWKAVWLLAAMIAAPCCCAQEPGTARPEIVVALSTNCGHGWNQMIPYYEPYLVQPLKKRLGSRILFLTKEGTPETIRRLVRLESVRLFVWIGGGLQDQIECNDKEEIDGQNWRPGFTPGAPELKGKIAFINAEFSTDYIKSLPTTAAFGYWTEMSTESHDKNYSCDYFSGRAEPMEWYGPYFILMGRVVQWMADGQSVQEASQKADALWAGFLKWVASHRSSVPHADDYLDLGKRMFGGLMDSIFGDRSARLAKTAVPPASDTKSMELGHRAELFTAEGQPHGFFNRSPWQEKTTQRMDQFLRSIGYLPEKPADPGP